MSSRCIKWAIAILIPFWALVIIVITAYCEVKEVRIDTLWNPGMTPASRVLDSINRADSVANIQRNGNTKRPKH
jgi:hypothetical protein